MFVKMRKKWNSPTQSLLLLALVALSGCLYPQAPNARTIDETKILISKTSEWVKMAPYTQELSVGPRNTKVTRTIQRSKNLLLIVADDVIGKKLGPELSKIYQTETRLEEVLWWFYAPKIQKSYNNVLRLHWNGFNKETFKQALASMETLKQDYDVMLLAHGIPNHLIASPGQGVISFRDIAAMKNTLKYADTLYLQACFGNSLAADFLDAGFLSVIAYEGLNWNFFYPQYFLDEMANTKGDPEKAHDKVVDHFDRNFKWSVQDREIVKRLFGEKPAEYLEDVQLPRLYD